MTSLSNVIDRPEADLAALLSQQTNEFLQGVKRGLVARSQGRFRPLDEVVAELEIDA